jgi:hypothetical protein
VCVGDSEVECCCDSVITNGMVRLRASVCVDRPLSSSSAARRVCRKAAAVAKIWRGCACVAHALDSTTRRPHLRKTRFLYCLSHVFAARAMERCPLPLFLTSHLRTETNDVLHWDACRRVDANANRLACAKGA